MGQALVRQGPMSPAPIKMASPRMCLLAFPFMAGADTGAGAEMLDVSTGASSSIRDLFRILTHWHRITFDFFLATEQAGLRRRLPVKPGLKLGSRLSSATPARVLLW
jgi:hypothetical protein